jgi:hypothetical protein
VCDIEDLQLDYKSQSINSQYGKIKKEQRALTNFRLCDRLQAPASEIDIVSAPQTVCVSDSTIETKRESLRCLPSETTPVA